MIRFDILMLAAALSLATPAKAAAQGIPTSSGDIIGTVRVEATCPPQSWTCAYVRNDARYPMEIASIVYLSPAGQITIEAPPVMGGRLQCVFPSDGRPCAPVLAPGQRGAVELPAPPAPGQLIVFTLKTWDPPGSEVGLPITPWNLGGVTVDYLGDPVSAVTAPAFPVSPTRRVVLNVAYSNLVTWGKGR